jgi:hypothetical protein
LLFIRNIIQYLVIWKKTLYQTIPSISIKDCVVTIVKCNAYNESPSIVQKIARIADENIAVARSQTREGLSLHASTLRCEV